VLQPTKITAVSMPEALEKAKQTLGDNAVILSTEEGDDTITLTATTSSSTTSPFLLKKSKTETEQTLFPIYKDVLSAIRAVCDICDAHQLSYSFCEKWLKELSKDFSGGSINLNKSLAEIVSFSSQWLHEMSSDEPIILVGPPGSGKTVTLAKIAVLLLSQNKQIEVLTLDTIKAGGPQQLQAYLNVMKQPLMVGHKHLLPALERSQETKNKSILLIDTQGINIFNEEDQDFIHQLSEQVKLPLTLVLPADINPLDAEETAKKFRYFNTEYLIATRFDVTKHYGGALNAVHASSLQLTAFSNGPALMESLHPLTAETMLSYLLPRK